MLNKHIILCLLMFRINSSGFHGFGLVERTFLQIVAVLAKPLADARLVGSRIIASSTSAAASAASARGRGLHGVLVLLLLDLGTKH